MAGPAFFADPSRASSPSYLWEIPGKPLVVRISLELVERLEREVVESFRSANARGSEIGGLLLGTVHGNNPSEVSIQDYELVPCDYSRGPLYRLAPPDVERLERAVEQRSANAGMRVAGVFRSHARKGLSLDADDVAIFTKLFPNMYQVALLVKPFATKPTLGGIFIREEGAFRTESSYKEFLFRKSELERNSPAVATLKTGEKAPAATTGTMLRPEPPLSRTTTRAQIVPIASRREVVSPPVQAAAAVPEPAPEVPPVSPRALSTDPAPAVIPTGAAAAAAQLSPALSETQTFEQPQPVAPADRKPASRSVPETADWVESFDFEKLLREGQEKAHLTESPHRLIDPKPAVAETAAPPMSAPAARAVPEMVAPVLPVPSDLELPEPSELVSDDAASVKLKSPKLMWIAGGTAAALMILSGLLFFPGIHRTKRAATASALDTSTMSLRVERSAGELLLTWNRDADAIRGATHAVLSISDGDRHEAVDLDLAQLRNGSIVYSPSSLDIVFQLTVTGKNASQTQSESVRVLRTPRPSPMPETPPASPSKPVPSRSGANAPAAQILPATEETAGDQAKPPNEVRRQFQTDSLASRLRQPRASDLPDAPGIPSGQQPQQVLLPGNFSAPPPPATPAPVAPPPAPAPASVAAVPATQPKVGGQVKEAQVLTQTSPEYPLAARQARVQGSVIVLAVVGADGRIKSAKALSGPPLLQNPAAAAVRQWLYKPATLNGIPVESETRIELNFTLQH